MNQPSTSLRMTCPHCGSFLRIRNSAGVTPTYREAWAHCTNEVECGFRVKLGIELIHTTCPSQRPNPKIELPLAPSLRQSLETDT